MKNNLRRCQSCAICKYGVTHEYAHILVCNLDGTRISGFVWNNSWEDAEKWCEEHEVSIDLVCDDWESDE